MPEIDNKLVSAWIKIQHEGYDSNIANELWWAWDKVYFMCRENADQAFTFILATLKEDSSDKVMENLSAGPLEDLLNNFGKQIIDRVESEAKANPKFASLLGGVWKSSIADDVWKRITLVWDRQGWDGIPEQSA